MSVSGLYAYYMRMHACAYIQCLIIRTLVDSLTYISYLSVYILQSMIMERPLNVYMGIQMVTI